MDAIVLLASQRGQPLVHGDDAECVGDPKLPHFYSYRGEQGADPDVVHALMEICDAIGPHRAFNGMRWCCPSGPPTGDDVCQVAADCTTSLYATEISDPAMCACRMCSLAPATRKTDARRAAAYSKLCKPGVDAQGRPCPLAKCKAPPAPICDHGLCRTAVPTN